MMSTMSPLAAARVERPKSTFRPPEVLLRSSAPRKVNQSLTAAAQPWTPGGGHRFTTAERSVAPLNAAVISGGPKPPAPLHSTPPLTPLASPSSGPPPPVSIGSSPAAAPGNGAIKTTKDKQDRASVLKLPPPASIELLGASQAITNSPISPLTCTTPLSQAKSVITEEAIESGVYTFDMFQCLRKDCSHTPRRALNWVVEMYRSTPALKVPAHLVLTVEEPLVDVGGGGSGSGSASGIAGWNRASTRRRPVRQVHHKVMSVLSRVTPQKYTELQKELLELPLKQTTDAELKEVVRVFFEKAVQEQAFSSLYANLVADICQLSPADKELEKEVRDKLLPSRMRRELLTTCQEEFTRPLQLSADDKVDPTTGRPLADEEVEFKRDRLKRRLCGNIKFVGELFKKKLVTERVVGSIMDVLVGDFDPRAPTEKEDYVFEVFQTLLKVVGAVWHANSSAQLDKFMALAKRIQCHPTPRVRFLMMDLEDLAHRGWVTKDRLLTMEELERQQVEEQRRGYEEIERRARARQLETDEYILSSGGSSNMSTPSAGGAAASVGSRGSQSSGMMRPPALCHPNFMARPMMGGPPPFLSVHHIDPRHPHGTPTASPAKPLKAPSTPVSATAMGTIPAGAAPSSPMMMTTPPPRYQRNMSTGSQPGSTTASDRSPIVHSNVNLGGMPPTQGMLSDSVASSSLTRASSNASMASSSGGFPATPLSPGPPLPLQDLAAALMTQYATNKKLDDVLLTLRSLSVQHRVCVLTFWLRRANTTTKLFVEREQICTLLYGILDCAMHPVNHILSAHDLAVCFLEWIRFDIECGQFENCPRLFANIGGMIAQAYQPNAMPQSNGNGGIPATAAEEVRSILNGTVFTILLRELHAHGNLAAIPTLVRDVQPVSTQLLNTVASLSTALMTVGAPTADNIAAPRTHLLHVLQNRFRILPFVLYGDGALTRAKTPSPRSSPINDASGGASYYDAFSQCLKFPSISEDPEFVLFRRIRESNDSQGWRDFAVQLSQGGSTAASAAKEHAASPAYRLSCAMKVLGTLLTVLHPKDSANPLCTTVRSEDLDDVVLSMLGKRRSSLEAQCAMVAELILHFTFTVSKVSTPTQADSPKSTKVLNSSQSQFNSSLSEVNTKWSTVDSRMGMLTEIFKRWCDSNMIQATLVLDVLGSIHELPLGDGTATTGKGSGKAGAEDLYTVQHNFLVEVPWSTVIASLRSC